jgi:hypothetical protein
MSILALTFVVGSSSCAASTPVDAESKLGSVSGRVTDYGGNSVREAIISVANSPTAEPKIVFSENDGSFLISLVSGPAELRVRAPGFADQSMQIVISDGHELVLNDIKLALEAEATQVVVTATRRELAEAAVKAEVQQRILGVIPNFMVTYDRHAVPLAVDQKFELAARTLVDPETIGMSAALAGWHRDAASQRGYGNGIAGFGMRFGSSYGTASMDTMLGSAVFPSIFKQDPRYFYKGTGSFSQRAMYAISMSVICKGDNGRWQYNYSGLLGGLVSGLFANLYNPPTDRGRWSTTFQSTAVGIGSSAVSNLLQEFAIRKFSSGTKPKP